MKSVVGSVPPRPTLKRPRSGGRLLPRRRRAQRPPRGTKVSARQFALLAFIAWGATLALLDWSFAALRQPANAFVEPIGNPEAPPPALLPEPDVAESAAPAAAKAEPQRRWWSSLFERDRGEAPAETAEEADVAAVEPEDGGRPLARIAGLDGLVIPVTGVSTRDLRDQFADPRSGGRRHQALDILAARNTPVVAALDGKVAKLYESKAGGLTIYQFDPTERHALYYAHLESYAPGLDEGDRLRKGQIIGYVGTSGNAPEDVPHLHFAIYRLGPEKRWHEGDPLNPYPLLARR